MAVGPATLSFHGSLLQLRGARLSANPLRHGPTGSVLLFNGEVFGGLPVPPGCNDAALLLEALAAPGASVPAVLSALRGPWALAYWHAPSLTLWFGRDAIGETPRSFLWHPLGGVCAHAWAHLASIIAAHLPSSAAQLSCTPACAPPSPQAAAACCCTCRAPGTAGCCWPRRLRWTRACLLRASQRWRRASIASAFAPRGSQGSRKGGGWWASTRPTSGQTPSCTG